MRLVVTENPAAMGTWVAEQAAATLREAIAKQGEARLIVATGASQFEVLKALVNQPDIAWDQVTGFHLDEYVGLAPQHPASFCRYLQERFVSQVTLKQFYFLHGDRDPVTTINEVAVELTRGPIDLALVGIGENGHLAFNDPPADFNTEAPYLIVELDQACRQQQVGEGWFETLNDVPRQAISMSIRQIMKTRRILCSVPDQRKSLAVQQSVEGPVDPSVPASILQQHPTVDIIVDLAAASRLAETTLAQALRP